VPDSHAFFLNGKAMEAATFRPISHHDDSLIKEGSYSYGSLIANEEMIREFPSLKVGDEVRFDIPFSLSRYGKKDEGNISFAFILSGIVKEFSFLNSPRFYYDYQLLASKMKETKLENISEALEVETTIESLVSSLPGEDAATNYSYFLFAGDKEEALSIEDIRKKQDDSSLSIEGDALASYEAYSSLMNAFLLSLLLFVGIAFLGVFFIVALSSYSSFAKRRKEAAILLALGARKRSVRNIYVQESMLVGALSSVASLSLFPLVTKFVNGYLEKTFSMGSLIAVPYQSFLGVPYLLPMLLLLFALLTSFASTSIALSILRKFPLATVLRDE
jgi:ABC-type antimicrobial peptide transport system permease subunit